MTIDIGDLVKFRGKWWVVINEVYDYETSILCLVREGDSYNIPKEKLKDEMIQTANGILLANIFEKLHAIAEQSEPLKEYLQCLTKKI